MGGNMWKVFEKTKICPQQAQPLPPSLLSADAGPYISVVVGRGASLLADAGPYVGVRGSPERDISSLRALGPGGGQISRVVHESARAAFGVFCRKCGFVQEGHTFIEKVWFRQERNCRRDPPT